MKHEEPQEEGPRSFAVFLQALADGDCHAQLTGELYRLGQALRTQARAQQVKVNGKLTLTLGLTTDKDGTTTEVTYDITRKDPKAARARSIRWLTKEGNLNPAPVQQMLFGIREVSDDRGDVRDAPEAPEVRAD